MVDVSLSAATCVKGSKPVSQHSLSVNRIKINSVSSKVTKGVNITSNKEECVADEYIRRGFVSYTGNIYYISLEEASGVRLDTTAAEQDSSE